ncbi:MAG: hypothetical protein M1814_000766 [Vezdaea aestivalis]|nr:MAG: hypothetical protein M1814_000766 [Vezdaea aestivalis]
MERPPLADYFWISGVDSLSFGHEQSDRPVNGTATPPPLSIQEGKLLEINGSERPPSGGSSRNKRHSRGDSLHRLSTLSNEARDSIRNVNSLSDPVTKSNRSSTTIKGLQINSTNGTGLSEVDFDKALFKFAEERDHFHDELAFSAGAVVVPTRPAVHPRTQKVKDEEGTGLRPSLGSLRRKLSYRELSSSKRQPQPNRSSSVRTSKRLSNYNSVIPAPQPLHTSENMYPLKRKFEPVLLDRYPPKSMAEETKRRGPFPDYVPMFAFPNDVSIVSADERPKSTWHGFAMTSGDNSRIFGICVLVWMPLNRRAAEDIEKRCEEWRRDNMSEEEREMAASLGERLAAERAKLSELLAKLPTMTSGSSGRETLETEISSTEEKIGLMMGALQPLRHGAAAKIDGLTDGETGYWTPRAYGVLGRDASLTSFWKEWLRAVVVPMTNGGVLRIPPSSPKSGMWQPIERYVVNLCMEAFSPDSSKTQVEVLIRELRLIARREAINELPQSRNIDLYALFRAMSIPNIVTLFESALAESRIILLSQHTSMLHLASNALVSLLYPMTWAGIFIPILPARLLSALEAPCPYIVGIERRYEKIELPEDDYVLVDLDRDVIESAVKPTMLPRAQRRKLISLLQLAAPHHNRFGVVPGPPAYAIESFPFDSFVSENPEVFTAMAPASSLAKFVGLTSTQFGTPPAEGLQPVPMFNAFLQSKNDHVRPVDRPSTSSTTKTSLPPSPSLSPVTAQFPPLPGSIPRNDSGFALTSTLREKRSGHFSDASSRRSSSVFGTLDFVSQQVLTRAQLGFDKGPLLRRPSIPFSHHSTSQSTSTISTDNQSTYRYAPSTYAASTLAASTIMPNVLHQPVRNTKTTHWVEGHCFQIRPMDDRTYCSICDEKADDVIYKCTGCKTAAHPRCVEQVCIVCPAAFYPDQIRAAFVRCFASLLYTYRKCLNNASGEQKKAGKIYNFNMDGFLRSLPHENADYMYMMRQTQGFNEFIHDREFKRANDPSILLFDQIILAKKNRGRASMFSKASTSFLSDTTEHLWVSAIANPPSSRFPGDYRQIISRIPAKLDPTLMKEPRVVQGKPRPSKANARRKPIPSMLGPNAILNGRETVAS